MSQHFWNYIISYIWKTVRASEKCPRKVDIRYRMAPWRMLYIAALSYIFKVTKFKIANILKTVRASKMSFVDVDIRHQMRPERMLFP